MGYGLRLFDSDKAFNESDVDPILVNDYAELTVEGDKALRDLLLTTYTSDRIEIDASCSCGAVTGPYNEGSVCPACGTVVEPTLERDVQSKLWVRAPDELHGLIRPNVYELLSSKLNKDNFRFLDFLLMPNYNPTEIRDTGTTLSDYRKMNEAFGKVRGYNYFIDHFLEIMEFIVTQTQIVKKKDRIDLVFWCRANYQLCFPKYIPIPSKLCFIIEETSSGRYADENLEKGIDAVLILAMACANKYKGRINEITKRVVVGVDRLSEFYKKCIKENISGKTGLLRKDIFGSRLHFTARAVIVSLSEPHHYQDLHIPYGVAVQLFRVHITNKLVRRGFTPNEALVYILQYTAQDSPLMWEILEELLAETPNGRGYPCLLTRNPSLKRGSSQYLYINKIKRDIKDNTFSMSVLILAAPNADFDGDQLSLVIMPDNEIAALFEKLAPHYWVFSTEKPSAISGDAKLQGPIVETISHWLEG